MGKNCKIYKVQSKYRKTPSLKQHKYLKNKYIQQTKIKQLFIVVNQVMITNYSSSKRRCNIRPVQIDQFIRNSRVTQHKPCFYDNYPFDFQTNQDNNQRSSSGLKSRNQEQNKQNYNIQSRQDKRIMPVHSPLKQPLFSPIKNSYQSFQRSIGNSKRKTNLNQLENIRSYYSKEEQKTYSNYMQRNFNPKKGSISYEVGFSNEENIQKQNIDEIYISRNQNYVNKNSPYINKNKTPQKHNPHIEVGELIQKSQFLKQRIDRISRMTPKSASRRKQCSKQKISPQKIIHIPVQIKQPVNQIVKYNKYCDQKLALQTIYDIQEHRHELNSNHPTQQVEQGIQKINCISKKINERLKNIINRHSK